MPVRVRLRLRRVNLNREQFSEPGNPIYEAHVRATQAAVKLAKEDAPERSGRLKESIESRIYQTPSGNLVGDVGISNKAVGPGTPPQQYAIYVMEGTSSPILPVNSNFLVIRDGGPVQYHRSVEGQSANPFLKRALNKVRKQDWGL